MKFTKLETPTPTYGKAPLFFMDKEKEQEWDQLDPNIKKYITQNLERETKKVSLELSIDMIVLAIQELAERIEKLEQKNETESS